MYLNKGVSMSQENPGFSPEQKDRSEMFEAIEQVIAGLHALANDPTPENAARIRQEIAQYDQQYPEKDDETLDPGFKAELGAMLAESPDERPRNIYNQLMDGDFS